MITTCPKCGRAYEEQSREEADSPNRMCLDCFGNKMQGQVKIWEVMKATDELVDAAQFAAGLLSRIPAFGDSIGTKINKLQIGIARNRLMLALARLSYQNDFRELLARDPLEGTREVNAELLEACKAIANDPYTTCTCAEKVRTAIAKAEKNCFRESLARDPLAPIKAEIELPEHARLRLQAKVGQVFGGGQSND